MSMHWYVNTWRACHWLLSRLPRQRELTQSCQSCTDSSWMGGRMISLKNWKDTTKSMMNSVEQGYVLWGTRVITPVKLRTAVLKEIHSGHPGIVKMKAIAWQYVWWPPIDMDIEKACKRCEMCQLEQSMPRKCHCILGNSQGMFGRGFTLILQDLSWATCSWLWLMHSQNG